MRLKTTPICIALFFVGFLLTTSLEARSQCKLNVSAVDSQTGSVIQADKYELVNHSTLKSTIKTSMSGIAAFEYPKDSKCSLKVKKQGFWTSVSRVPDDCTSSPAIWSVKTYPGESTKEVFILDWTPTYDADGKVNFDAKWVWALGVSWPRPASAPPPGCETDCTITVDIDIDTNGDVTNAKARTGNPNFWKSASKAAIKSKFRPVLFNGRFVPVKTVMTYVFGRT
jgi:hypothetical protein